jgi:hypothetical protein
VELNRPIKACWPFALAAWLPRLDCRLTRDMPRKDVAALGRVASTARVNFLHSPFVQYSQIQWTSYRAAVAERESFAESYF